MTVKRSEKVTKLQPFLRCAEPIPAEMELEQDDIAWATRSGMWQSRAEKASARRTKRAKARPALILAGHGVSLRVEKGALTIRNGFTHYPQQPQVIRYFRGDVALPERIILLDGSGSVSFDVLPWLAEQKSASSELTGRAIFGSRRSPMVMTQRSASCMTAATAR
jgi:hypothetical protein